MYDILICEDDRIQLNQITKIIKNQIMIEDFPMRVSLTTKSPEEVLLHLADNQDANFIYFLDIDLESSVNGIELAEKIRKTDSLGRIIFITAHEEMAPLTFKYKVEALDFISKSKSKSDISMDVNTVLSTILTRDSLNMEKRERLSISLGSSKKFFEKDAVLFFETTGKPHRLYLHTKTGRLEFYGKLKEMENFGNQFLRVHKACVVNMDNILEIDEKRRLLIMPNQLTCPIGRGQLKKIRLALLPI